MRTISTVAITCLGVALMATSAHADLVASWGFQGTLNSDMGGAALIGFDPLGQNSYTTTTLYGQSRQVYNMVGSQGAGNNAGLQLIAPSFLADNSDYSIEILFSQTNSPNTNGWRKIYDNSNRVDDQGLYVSPSSTMDYYPHSGGTASIADSTFYNVVMTFNNSTNLTDIYVNGVLDSSTTGTEPNIADNTIPLSFFMDDAATGFGEYSDASVGLIRMWNMELSAGDVATIERNPFTAAPEPASMAALGFGVLALIARRRRLR
jgi:Concanavalin A-like lectin/glucanases superfamily/PEP-CTERM motif